MENDLKNNVVRLLEAGVPEEEIAKYIQSSAVEPEKQQEQSQYKPITSPEGRLLMARGDILGTIGPTLNISGQKMLSNVPSSFKSNLSYLASMLMHPMETAKGVGTLLGGTISKMAGQENAYTRQADTFGRAMKERYGGKKNIERTMETDPVGFLADVATIPTAVGGAGGLALKALPQTRNIRMLSGLAKKATNLGAQLEPLSVTMRGAGEISKAVIPSGVAQKLYASSAKMSTVLNPEERGRLAQLALDNQVALNKKGYKKLSDEVFSLTKQVDNIVENNTLNARYRTTISQVLSGLDEWEKRSALTGKSHVVKNIKKVFLRDNSEIISVDGKNYRVLKELDANQLNRMKRDLYKEVNSYYGKAMAPLRVDIKKTIARQAKEILEDWNPEIKPKNEKATDYLDIMDAIQSGVNRIENRDLTSIGLPLKSGGAVVVSDALGIDKATGGVLGLALGVLDLPSVKSRIALRINNLKKQGVKIRPSSAAIRLGLTQTERSKGE